MQDGLKTINQSIANIRSLVTTLHTSPTKYHVFLTCCQNIGLKLRNVPLDVKTSWNSTYKMLEVVTKYKAALELFQTNIKHQPFLTDEDWDIASLWREHLVQFYESTEIISGSNYPTIPLVLKEITKIKDICLEIENNDLSKQFNVCDMKSKFAKHFGDLPLIYGLGVICKIIKMCN